MGSDELLEYVMRTNRHRYSCFGRWNQYHTVFCVHCEHQSACRDQSKRRARSSCSSTDGMEPASVWAR